MKNSNILPISRYVLQKQFTLILAWLLTVVAAQAQLPGDNLKTVYTITHYGAVPDGKTINTNTIQKAIDDCHQHGGGIILIPTGEFVTGTLRLYSNMNLYLQPGSVLTGSRDNKDYLYQKDFGFTGLGAGNKTGLLVAHNEHNISITGFGTIKGNGESFMYMDSLQYGMDFKPAYTRQKNDYMNPKYGREDGPVLWKGSYEERPGVMVMFSDCHDVTVSDIRIQDSPNWTLAFLYSESIKISGIRILNNMNIPNSDGIDLYDSKNVTISDCNIQAGDDAIAVISSSNVTATNCILHSRSSGIRVGYNVYNNNNSGNLLFNNISIYDSNRGIGIYQRQKGDMEHMVFSNIIISTRLHSGQWWGHGEPIHISSIPGLGSTESGTISHLQFSNITASSESGIVIYAFTKASIHDISFDNVDLSIKRGALANSYGGNIDLRPTNNIAFGIFTHSIPAVYSYQADNLVIKDMTVHWGKDLPGYFTHAADCENSGNVIIDGLREQATDNKHAAMATVHLQNCKEAMVEKISSTDKGKKLVTRN